MRNIISSPILEESIPLSSSPFPVRKKASPSLGLLLLLLLLLRDRPPLLRSSITVFTLARHANVAIERKAEGLRRVRFSSKHREITLRGRRGATPLPPQRP